MKWAVDTLRVALCVLLLTLALQSEAHGQQATDRTAVMDQLVKDLYDRLAYLDTQLAAAKVIIDAQQKALRAANVSATGPPR